MKIDRNIFGKNDTFYIFLNECQNLLVNTNIL